MKGDEYLITEIPQVDGGVRRLFAPNLRAQREAQEALRRDPATVEALSGWGLLSRVEDGWPVCRAYDATFGNWLGPAESEAEARARAKRHQEGQRAQGGMFSQVVIAHPAQEGPLALDEQDEPIWPPWGRSSGAVRWGSS